MDSVEHRKVKKAQELINKVSESFHKYKFPSYFRTWYLRRFYQLFLQRAYTKEALDNYSHFTSVVDTPDVVLAKINSVNQSDVSLIFLETIIMY